MGSAGHKFVAHTKALSPRAQNSGGGYGLPPHPIAVRAGQRYWPRTGARRVPFQVRSVKGGRAVGRQEDAAVAVTASLARLLALGEDGQGRWYQFHGFTARRYRTLAVVCDVDERAAMLCVPEWHPRRPVHLFRTLLPDAAAHAGAWLALTCDLSASSAARLQPAQLQPVAPPSAGTFHAPDVRERGADQPRGTLA